MPDLTVIAMDELHATIESFAADDAARSNLSALRRSRGSEV